MTTHPKRQLVGNKDRVMRRETSPSNALTAYPDLKGIEYVELFVGNVRQAAHYYKTAWGFQTLGFQGLDTGVSDRVSIIMRQHNITLLLTGTSRSSSEVAAHLQLHGEGVARIAFSVSDVKTAYEAALNRGARAVSELETMSDEDGQITRAEIMAFDGFSHVFVDRSCYEGALFPHFRKLSPDALSDPMANDLDHIAIAVESGTLESWVAFYRDVFGFKVTHSEDVATERSGMRSRVVEHPSGVCRFPLVEPAVGKKKSQVQEFLSFNNGPGIQHIAVSTSSIVDAVSRLRMNGVDFLRVPAAYYQTLESRVGVLGKELAKLAELGVLVDHDEWGRLLQIFARPCQDRPTMFFEVIERRGARGFGGGNIRALFDAVEREQELRGTL